MFDLGDHDGGEDAFGTSDILGLAPLVPSHCKTLRDSGPAAFRQSKIAAWKGEVSRDDAVLLGKEHQESNQFVCLEILLSCSSVDFRAPFNRTFCW